MSARRAFTLLELMVASGILVLVVGGTLTAFIGVRNMTATAIAEAELSVRMRELREKLLFHVAPPHDGRVWSGLLSGSSASDVIEGGGKIVMPVVYGYDLSGRQTVDQKIELVSVSDATMGTRFFGNDGDRHDERAETRWLDPGRLSWLPSGDFLESVRGSGDRTDVFYVTLEACPSDVRNRDRMTRRERVAVPVFGRTQTTLEEKVFDD